MLSVFHRCRFGDQVVWINFVRSKHLTQLRGEDMEGFREWTRFYMTVISLEMLETWVWSLGQKYPLEKETATHSSVLAWETPWTRESGRIQSAAAAAAKLLQSCPTLCDPIDGSPPGSPVPGILQARTLEWAAISFSNAWKWKVKVKLLSRAWLVATPWTAAHQAPPSMGFSRQEYWSGVPLPSQRLQSLGSQKSWTWISE